MHDWDDSKQPAKFRDAVFGINDMEKTKVRFGEKGTDMEG